MKIEDAYDKIYRYCYSKVRHRETAEDLTQETFLRFLRGSYEERGKEMNYLYTIARNLCAEQSRKKAWEELSPEEPDHAGKQAQEQRLDTIVMRQALLQLEEEDREIIFLRFINEEPLGVISKLTGISRFALYRRIQNILKALRAILEEDQ